MTPACTSSRLDSDVVEQFRATVFIPCLQNPVAVVVTTHADNRVWQDVYHGQWNEAALYIKFQRISEYFVVSFKEL